MRCRSFPFSATGWPEVLPNLFPETLFPLLASSRNANSSWSLFSWWSWQGPARSFSLPAPVCAGTVIVCDLLSFCTNKEAHSGISGVP